MQEGGPEKHFIHNHARFTILYHKDVETDLARIVGFEVEPASVKHTFKEWNVNDPKIETCTADKHPMENPSGCAAAREREKSSLGRSRRAQQGWPSPPPARAGRAASQPSCSPCAALSTPRRTPSRRRSDDGRLLRLPPVSSPALT